MRPEEVARHNVSGAWTVTNDAAQRSPAMEPAAGAADFREADMTRETIHHFSLELEAQVKILARAAAVLSDQSAPWAIRWVRYTELSQEISTLIDKVEAQMLEEGEVPLEQVSLQHSVDQLLLCLYRLDRRVRGCESMLTALARSR